MKFDSLLFDLDGTLWDSTAPVTQAWNEVLKKQVPATTLTRHDIEKIMGLPHSEILDKILPGVQKQTQEKVAEVCYEKEVSVLSEQGGSLFPGVVEGLEKLHLAYPLFIVSNCQTSYLDVFYRTTKLKKFFKGDICHGETGRAKGENILLLMKKFSLKNPALIGDTSSDERAAKLAKITFFHAGYGFGTLSKACMRFADFSSVVQYFLSA